MLSITEIKESLSFSARSLVVNKLRTFLSLLGVTIGIFAIISIFSLVDSMEANIKGMIATMGDDLVMVQKWPMTVEDGETEYPWWKYWQRPEPSLKDMDLLLERMQTAQNIAFRTDVTKELSYFNNTISNGIVLFCTESMEEVYPFEIEEGRFFTSSEEQMGKAVCLVGYDIANTLFGSIPPIGKTIKIGGRKAEIIGIFKREGESILGNNVDDVVFAPVTFGRQLIDLSKSENTLLVKAKEGVSLLEMKDEMTGILRSIHRLRPNEEKDFALNEMSMITSMLDSVFGFFTLVAIVIGSFSILVGGFGIANIMFVSVKERTSIIGIQKALGAKQAFILLQFLVESIFLSLIGGLVALLIIFILGKIATNFLGIEIFLSYGNISLGLAISLAIGVIAGFVPAWQASKLDPVEAIRS